MKTPSGTPPIIIQAPNNIVIDDTEPLNSKPDDTWANPIHFECRLTLLDATTGLYRCEASGTSNSSNAMIDLEYVTGDNTIVAVLNEAGGGNFSGGIQYTAANPDYVFLDARKGGSQVGRVKHKISYGNV